MHIIEFLSNGRGDSVVGEFGDHLAEVYYVGASTGRGT